MPTNSKDPETNSMSTAEKPLAGQPKYCFGSTNRVGGAASAVFQPNQSTVNASANAFIKTISSRIRSDLEEIEAKRLADESVQITSTGNANMDLIAAVVKNIRQEFMRDVREKVYADYEGTVMVWKDRVERALRVELREEVRKDVIKVFKKKGSKEFNELSEEVRKEMEAVKADLKAQMTRDIQEELQRGQVTMRAELEKKHKANLKNQLRSEVRVELKREMRHSVKKQMRQSILRKLAQSDSEPDSADDLKEQPPAVAVSIDPIQAHLTNGHHLADHQDQAPAQSTQAPPSAGDAPTTRGSTANVPPSRIPSPADSLTTASSERRSKRKSEELEDETGSEAAQRKRIQYGPYSPSADYTNFYPPPSPTRGHLRPRAAKSGGRRSKSPAAVQRPSAGRSRFISNSSQSSVDEVNHRRGRAAQRYKQEYQASPPPMNYIFDVHGEDPFANDHRPSGYLAEIMRAEDPYANYTGEIASYGTEGLREEESGSQQSWEEPADRQWPPDTGYEGDDEPTLVEHATSPPFKKEDEDFDDGSTEAESTEKSFMGDENDLVTGGLRIIQYAPDDDYDEDEPPSPSRCHERRLS